MSRINVKKRENSRETYWQHTQTRTITLPRHACAFEILSQSKHKSRVCIYLLERPAHFERRPVAEGEFEAKPTVHLAPPPRDPLGLGVNQRLN
jgi:hypothetical protein